MYEQCLVDCDWIHFPVMGWSSSLICRNDARCRVQLKMQHEIHYFGAELLSTYNPGRTLSANFAEEETPLQAGYYEAISGASYSALEQQRNMGTERRKVQKSNGPI